MWVQPPQDTAEPAPTKKDDPIEPSPTNTPSEAPRVYREKPLNPIRNMGEYIRKTGVDPFPGMAGRGYFF